jgi:carbamoyltransferase
VTIFGINENAHDAAVSVIKDGEILFAAHSERYSKIKNDWYLNSEILNEALSYGYPDVISFYEHPFSKKLRVYLKGGKYSDDPFYKKFFPKNIKIKNFNHHYTHACAGYYTSKFKDAVIVVLDAIGEWDTSSIWIGSDNKIKKNYKTTYPFSFGLFYGAFTKLLGFEPNRDEYIVMGLSSYGNPEIFYEKVSSYFPSIKRQSYNFHYGIVDWSIKDGDKADIAASVQKVYEERLLEFMKFAQEKTKKTNLVFVGGCALNCAANTKLWSIFDNVWIIPNPGDAGCSLGAAAAYYGDYINWKSPYLGKNIGDKYPTKQIFKKLKTEKIVAVCNGKAEFGPRALGNRSIFADPRDPNIKDKVNKIKQREMFRPFAPVILEEDASKWFDMNFASPYMQYVVKCKKPKKIPSVVHVDGTSRVQTVNKNQHEGLYNLLKEWKKYSGIPILLNTSLNIKNQPLLNDMNDVKQWLKTYNKKIII